MAGKKLRKLIDIRTLAVLSPLLLVVFLVRWLDSQYLLEKAELTKELSRRYHESRMEVSDNAIYDELIGPMMLKDADEKGAGMHVETWIDTGTGVNVLRGQKTIDVNIKAPAGKGRTTSVSRILIKDGTPSKTEDSILKRMVKVLISKGMQTKLQPVRIDDTALHRHYERNLLAAGYHFHLAWVNNKKRDQDIYIGPDFPVAGIGGVVVTGYAGYLFRKLLPEILFAAFLLVVTTAAIVVIYRSMRAQQKLSLMKNELISNMTHELKTPIATVKVALEVLEQFEVKDPATIKDFLGMAVLEMNRLELLVNQALNTSLLESGEMKIITAREDVLLLTQQIVQALMPRVEQANGSLTIDYKGSGFYAEIDKLHYQGVIINLVDNALKYGGKQPAIRISMAEQDKTITVAISDNGPGIPAQFLGRVFDKFFRVPSGNVHNTKGYGLGLSYASKVMEQHGGSLTVQNLAEGGCCFTITLQKALT